MSSYTHKPLKNKISNNSNGKCGEITFCIQVDKRVYALNCLYCSQICLQWDMFINHMEQMHDAELNSEYPLHTENDESELNVNDYTADFASTLEVQLKTPNNAQLNSTATSHLDDPLEEEYYLNPSSMPVKVEHFDYTPNELMMDDQGDTTTNSQDDKELSDQDYEIDGDDNFTDNDDLTSKSSNSNNDNDINEKVTYDKRQLNELLIKYYKDHPVLWNTNKKEHKNDMKHNDAYKNITKMINKDMNLKLKCIQIKGKINKLKSKFRNEQQLIIDFQESKEKVDPTDDEDNDMESAVEEQKPISWLYQKMSFLKDHINLERKRSKRGTKALTNDKCYLPLAKLTLDKNQQIIELYKSYPCLWDVNHIGYRFKTQRQEGLQELLKVVNEQMNLNLSLDELQKKLYYIRYAYTQEKHREIECNKLKIDFKPQCKLYTELLFLKDSVGPFKCEYCEEIFNGPDQYKIHKCSHDGSMPYTCPICKKGFMKVGNCTVHLRRHTKDYQFECKECGKKFPTSTDLNVHSRHHTGEKPYFCDICGQSFRTWTYFDSHRRRHEMKPNHKCTICFKGFYENNKLKQHMKSHANIRDKECNICGKSFTCTKYLNQHKQTHSEKKKYSCKICGKNFAQYGGLSSHIRSHGATTSSVINGEDNDEDIMEHYLESE